MSIWKDQELDALFEEQDDMEIEEEDRMEIEEPAPTMPPQCTPRGFAQFLSLPAELQNAIFEEYFAPYMSAKTIRINENGEIIRPAIIGASKYLRDSNSGYFTTWLKKTLRGDTDFLIEAQIRNFEHEPLQRQLRALSVQFSVPKENLVARTKVTFIGDMDANKLMDWVWHHLEDPKATAIFEQSEAQTVQLSGFGSLSLMCSRTSVTEALRLLTEADGIYAWKSSLLKFLEYAGELGFDAEAAEEMASPWDVMKVVFRVVAEWHFDLMKNGKRQRTRFIRNRDRVVRDTHEMAQLVYTLVIGMI